MEEFDKAAIKWVIAKLKGQRGNQVNIFIGNLKMQANKDYALSIVDSIRQQDADKYKTEFQEQILQVIREAPDKKETVMNFLKSFGYNTKEIEKQLKRRY